MTLNILSRLNQSYICGNLPYFGNKDKTQQTCIILTPSQRKAIFTSAVIIGAQYSQQSPIFSRHVQMLKLGSWHGLGAHLAKALQLASVVKANIQDCRAIRNVRCRLMQCDICKVAKRGEIFGFISRKLAKTLYANFSFKHLIFREFCNPWHLWRQRQNVFTS